MTGLHYTTPYGLWRVACATTIMDIASSQRTLWVPNDEQVGFWRVMGRYQFSFGAKPRKIGWSLAGSHATLHEVAEAGKRGNRMRAVFAIDTDAKAQEHLERADDMAAQFRLRCKARRSAPYSLVFPGGSHYDFLTMGSDEPGRGGDIHRLQVTELPYAAHPEKAYHALRSSCSENAPVHIETTLTTLDPFTAALWRGQRRHPVTRQFEALGTEFHRHVSFVEAMPSYRLATVEA